MKLCFYGNFTGRGAEKATLDVANLLKDDYTIVVLNSNDRELAFELDSEIEYCTLKSNGTTKKIIELKRFIKKNNIDVLIMVEALTGISGMPAAKLAGCKMVVWDHSNYYQTKGSKFAKITRQIELITCDAVILLTKRDVSLYKKHYKFIRARLVQIYNFINIDTHWKYDNSSKTVISVGHIDSNKNFAIIPEIAQAAFKEDSEWIWEIYGNGSTEETNRIKNQIKNYHMEQNVFLRGFEKNMDEVYNKAALVVMTSKFEGFPLVLIEAKSHGIPIVSFNVDTGPDEIIEDNVNGYLVRCFDINEMTSKITQLVKNKELRMNFSQGAFRGLDRLDVDTIRHEWKVLLGCVLNTK